MSTRPDERPQLREADGDGEEPETTAPPATLEELTAAEDVSGLLALAKAYRSGSDGLPKDLPKCLACYRAAAGLGSAEAEYSAALFSLTGGVVAQDLKEGAARLRVAADGGYVPAKVYLANLYELGVHYTADAEKADVWYRSAARAAAVDDDPESDAYARAMADLGCVRFALRLAEALGTSPEDCDRLLRKAKAYGYQLKLRAERRADAAEELPSGGPTGSMAPSPPVRAEAERPATARKEAPKERKEAPKEKPPAAEPAVKRERTPRAHALWAFFFESLFVGASVAAGVLAHLGALELLARRAVVPVVGPHVELILPAFLFAIGGLPAFLMYKAGTVLRAMGLGVLAGGIGYALWESGRLQLLAGIVMQSVTFAVAGFLATLLVFGLLGGVKPPRRPVRRIVS